MAFEYKCYMLDKKSGMVYGIITESKDAFGYFEMQNYQGKLVPMSKKPHYSSKYYFSDEKRYDFTLHYNEAFDHLMNFKKLKTLQK